LVSSAKPQEALSVSAPRLSYANVVATLCLVVMIGAGAVAAIAQTGGTQLAACYKTKGNMRFLTKATAKCKKGEKKVTWSQTGPQGAAGAAGAAGARGAAGADAVAPAGAVMFFDQAACPAGWTAYDAARGRYLVGTPSGGAASAVVGTALGDQENRAVGQHSHGVTDPGHGHQLRGSGAALRVPSSVVSFAGRTLGLENLPVSNTFNSGILPEVTGITIDPSGSVPGTTAPYVQLLACRKD
jgi:hypothetical protein